MATSAAASAAGIDRHARRRHVEAALSALGSPSTRRSPPPEGRLGANEDHGRRLRDVLIDLGPVFAGFGRYLASRFDLLPRRARTEFDAIADEGDRLPSAAVAELIRRELGASPERLFSEFHETPIAVGLWVQRHIAWLAPGVPVFVTIVRPDAAAHLDLDLPLLPLLASWLGVPGVQLAEAIDDYTSTLRRRLDQRLQASSLTSLAADARAGGGLGAPECYRDHCAPNILTVERVVGEPLSERTLADPDLARRITAAWLRQAFSGSVIPYDFDSADLVVSGDRLILTTAAFEPHPSSEHARFAAYLGAVAGDNPDGAANWILEGDAPPTRVEGQLRRMLRQAVPFRDGEWSGDDRLTEHVLVQWRVATEAGCSVSPHHQHLYRGLLALERIADRLAPDVDTLLMALEDERMRVGLAQAGQVLNPGNMEAMLDRAVQELIALPQRLDDVLTRAAEGRLRTKLHVPESEAHEHARNRTVLLVTTLVAFAALASVLRQIEPAFGPGVERIGALLLLILGGWLLLAAARL